MNLIDKENYVIKITDNIMLKKNEKLYLENNHINNFMSRIAIFAHKDGGHYVASLERYKMKKQHNYTNIDNEDSKSNIIVKVVAASICQSDRRALLGTKHNSFKEKKIILGHEGGGYIIDPGPWHKQLYVGQKVVFLPHVTCGICEQCTSGNTNLCRKLSHLGFHINGCFTNIAVLPRQSIKPLPNEFVNDAMPLIEPLACVIHALFKIIDKLNVLNDKHKNNKVNVQPFTIYGSGPIGTLIAITLKLLWPYVKIRIIDILETRLQIAHDLQIADYVSHVDSEYPQH
jgi:threonine dehydrogenase-like Zn-dependent dehydrogenase